VLIDWLRGSQMELRAHGTLQWMALLTTLGILFIVLSRLRGDAVGKPVVAVEVEAPKAQRVAWLAPLIAGVMLLGATGGIAALPVQAAAPRVFAPGEVPSSMSGWQLASVAPTWISDPVTETQSLAITYHRDGDDRAGRDMRVTVVETLLPAVKLPEAGIISQAPGWHVTHIDKPTACASALCVALLHRGWQRIGSKDRRELYYLYASGNHVTNSRLGLRLIQGLQRLGGGGTARLIAVSFDGYAAPSKELAVIFTQLQTALDQGLLASNAP